MAKLTGTLRPGDAKESSFEELKQCIHGKLVDKLDLSRVGDLDADTLAAKSAWWSSTSTTPKTRC